MPPEKHALLSASSASRWLKCTAAPRFEEHLPERTSEYAEEGRLAHAICELKTLKKFTVMTSRTYTTRLNKLKKDPLYSEEMDKTSDLYIEHLIEQAMLYDSTPTVVAEVQVDFGEYVPEGFGTCDNVMIGGDTLSITDYKHGKGVPVSAVGNPQMRLYALGALKRYAPVFGDAIKKVRMSIDQPRLDSYTTDTITVEELMAWGGTIGTNPFHGILSIVILAPWAFVGFEVISLETAHFRFRVEKAGRLITFAILMGGCIYVVLALTAIVRQPENLDGWQAYVQSLDQLDGIASVPTFFVLQNTLGTFGAIVGFGYVSAATYRAAKQEDSRRRKTLGTAGVVLAAGFAAASMICWANRIFRKASRSIRRGRRSVWRSI